jgi:outer membrane protein assembly factor BamB
MNSPIRVTNIRVTNRKQSASFKIVSLMLATVPLWLMLTVANTSAQTSNDVSSSATTAGTPSETVLGVGNVGNLQLKWKGSVGLIIQQGMASPVVANGIVYCSLFDNAATALNASTGATLWTFLKADDSFPLAVANGVAYVGGEDGNTYALNASTGAKLWNFTPANAALSTFVVASSGVVYVGSNDNSVYALNASTGAKLWNFAVGGFPWSSAVANAVVYVGTGSRLGTGPGTVYALNANTGGLLWKYATGGTVNSSPTVANGVVYIASNDGELFALNAGTGVKLWDFATGDSAGSSPAVANGVVYVGSTNNNVYALNASTGARLWSFATGATVNSSPAVANGVVYFDTISAGNNGELFALNASTGAALWSYFVPSSQHSFTSFSGINVVDGAVYVSTATGDPDPQELDDFPLQSVYAFSLGADLFLRVQPSATTVHQGDLLTYAFPVWNLGPVNADHELLTTHVPEGTTLDYVRISGTPGLGTCTTPPYEGTGEIVCHENSAMAPNTTWTVRVVVKVTAPAGTVITESATTTEDTLDPNLANNTSTISTTVQ